MLRLAWKKPPKAQGSSDAVSFPCIFTSGASMHLVKLPRRAPDPALDGGTGENFLQGENNKRVSKLVDT